MKNRKTAKFFLGFAIAAAAAAGSCSDVGAAGECVARIGATCYDTLNNAVSNHTGDDPIVLQRDVDNGNSYIAINKNLTIDLNGYDIISSSAYFTIAPYAKGAVLTIKDSIGTGRITNTGSGYPVAVGKGGKFVLESGSVVTKEGTAAAAVYAYLGDSADAPNEIVINGGNVYGYYYAAFAGDYDSIVVNGGNISCRGNCILNNGSDVADSFITINGGNITQLDNDQPAIYHPGPGALVVNGGTIQGGSGIEMRAGNLTITSGNVIATATELKAEKNSNGASVKRGAAVAISQHTTARPIHVDISGGEFTGLYAFYQANIEENPADAVAQISADISGGYFTSTTAEGASFYSEDLRRVVRGGYFSLFDSVTYLKNGYILERVEDYDHVVWLLNVSGLDFIYDLPDYEEIYLIDDVEEELASDQSDLLAESEYKDSIITSSIFSIYLLAYPGEQIIGFDLLQDFTESPLTFTLNTPEEALAEPEGVIRSYFVLAFHDDLENGGYTLEKLPVVFNEDGTYSFATTSLSTFALAYEEKLLPKAPNTGAPDCSAITTQTAINTCIDADIPITLGADVSMDSRIVIRGNKSARIDLSGHNITVNGDSVAFHVRQGSLFLEGTGIVQGSSEYLPAIRISGSSSEVEEYTYLEIGENITIKNDNYSAITLDDNSSSAIYGVNVHVKGTLEGWNGIIIESPFEFHDYAPLIILDNAVIHSKNHAILAKGYSYISMYDSEITAGTGIGLIQGHFVVDGTNITATGINNPTPVPNGDYIGNTGSVIQIESVANKTDRSVVIIEDGTLTSQHGYVITENARNDESIATTLEDFTIVSGALHGTTDFNNSIATSSTGAFFWYFGDGRMMADTSYCIEDDPDLYDGQNMTIVTYAFAVSGIYDILDDPEYDYIETLRPVYAPLASLSESEEAALKSSEYKDSQIVNVASIRIFRFDKDIEPVIPEPGFSKPWYLVGDTGENHPLTFYMENNLEEAPLGYVREYYMLNFHPENLRTGEYTIEKLPITIAEEQDLYLFNAHRFSTFALAYVDTPIRVPDTSVKSSLPRYSLTVGLLSTELNL